MTALSYHELVGAIRHARDHDPENFTIVSHSFELLCRGRKRINKIVRRRFERLCAGTKTTEGVETTKGVKTTTYSQSRPDRYSSAAPRAASLNAGCKSGRTAMPVD